MTDFAWRNFKPGPWQSDIDTRNFIQLNYTPYDGDQAFLVGPTERTKALNQKYIELKQEEMKRGGVLDIDTEFASSLLSYKPGYLDKENEIILGLQTDAPLKRGVNLFGGIRLAKRACQAYGHEISPGLLERFTYRTTHNEGVFRVYTEGMKAARHSGVITGLPDSLRPRSYYWRLSSGGLVWHRYFS